MAQKTQGDMEELIIPADYVVGCEDETSKEGYQPQVRESVTFENFAMLLNLINNVYIKNNI